MMEARGVPSALLLTEPFTEIAQEFAAGLGAPLYQVTSVPHPISSADAEELRSYASAAADDLIRNLTAPAHPRPPQEAA